MTLNYMVFLVTVGSVLLSGCTDDTGSNVPDVTDNPLKNSNAVVITVKKAGDWVEDTVTGALFSCDAAGDSLVVVPLSDGEISPPVKGTIFLLESRSGAHMKIGVPRSAGEQVLLYGWGLFNGAGTGYNDSLRWVGLAPVNDTADTVVFAIPDVDANGLYRRAKSSWSGFSRFSLSVVKGGSTEATTLAHFHTLAARAIITLLDTLPASLQDSARARVRGDYRYSLSITSSSYYKGLWKILGLTTPRCLIGLNSIANQSSVAHEMGHYLSHILLGDSRYRTLENLAPDGDHGPGVLLEGRTSITEEYAYFTEYFLTGAINTVADPLVVEIFFGKEVKPDKIDMPSVEGFGTVLLALMQSNDTTIIDFEKKKDTVPILGASFSELYGVLAEGPTTINELRHGLAKLTASHAFDTGFQICAERAGWSYHGKGKVVDSEGNVVDNATVFCALPFNKKLKLSCKEVQSSDKGMYEIPRLYPGRSKLYAVVGTDTTSVEVELSWDSVTNRAVTLPDIQLSALKIVTITPSSGYSNDTITVKGKGFGASRGSSKVLFGTVSAVSYPLWSDTVVKVRIPNNARPGEVIVKVGATMSNGQPFTVLSGIVRDLRKATTISVRWAGEHEFSGASGSKVAFEAFSINTDELAASAPSVGWSNDSFHVVYSGPDALKKEIELSIHGKVNAWGDTLLGLSASWTRSNDSCETGGTVPVYSFSYSLGNVRLNDHNTTFRHVNYRENGEKIATLVNNQTMRSITCSGTTEYVATQWESSSNPPDIDIYFEW